MVILKMDLFSYIMRMTHAIIDNKEYLGQLDSNTGDGDLGITMELGCTSMNKTITRCIESMDIGELLIECGVQFNSVAPSTMGTLLAMSIIEVGKVTVGLKEINIDRIPEYVMLFVNKISKLGKAKLGDKTLLDVLIPISIQLERDITTGVDYQQALMNVARLSEECARNTKGMIAKIGRARWVAERSQEYEDAGAVLCSIALNALV